MCTREFRATFNYIQLIYIYIKYDIKEVMSSHKWCSLEASQSQTKCKGGWPCLSLTSCDYVGTHLFFVLVLEYSRVSTLFIWRDANAKGTGEGYREIKYKLQKVIWIREKGVKIR